MFQKTRLNSTVNVLLAIGLIFSLSSCSFISSIFTDTQVRELANVSQEESTQLFNELYLDSQHISELRIQSDIILSKGILSRKFLQSFVFIRPDKLRIDTFVTSLNRLVSLIVTNNGKYGVLDSEKKLFHKGFVNRNSLMQILKAPLTVDSFILAVCGKFNPSNLIKWTIYRDINSNSYVLIGNYDRDLLIDLEFNKSDQTNSEIIISKITLINKSSNKIESEIRYSYSNSLKVEIGTKQIIFPNIVDVVIPSEGGRLSIEHERVLPGVSKDHADKIFKISPPKGIKVVEQFGN